MAWLPCWMRAPPQSRLRSISRRFTPSLASMPLKAIFLEAALAKAGLLGRRPSGDCDAIGREGTSPKSPRAGRIDDEVKAVAVAAPT